MRLALGMCVGLLAACSEDPNPAPIADGDDGTSDESGSVTEGEAEEAPDDGDTADVDSSDGDSEGDTT